MNTHSKFQSLEVSRRIFSNQWKCGAAALLVLASCSDTSAVILAVEDFSAGSALWIDRDAGEMAVSHAAGFGDPLGSLHGAFASQGAPAFESDAFRVGPASSSGQFTGNLYLNYGSVSDVRFAFYAEDVLPSTFIFRIGDGTNTFINNISAQVSTPATWTTVSVSLAYAGGWLGGNATSLSNAFSGLNFMDVQVARNGTGAQDYFLDNFTLFGGALDLSHVPEPGSIGLLLVGGFMLRLAYKRRRARALIVRYEKG